MARIWRYVVASDTGFAPCIDESILSLCCCKPVIRKYAAIGDYVLGFSPKNMGIGKLTWAGIISEKMLMGEYQQVYPTRRDAIYVRVDLQNSLNEKLSHNGSLQHNTPADHIRDKSGKFALLFNPFWYWGDRPAVLPEDFHGLCHYYVGQTTRIDTLAPNVLEQLICWLFLHSEGVTGKPRGMKGKHTKLTELSNRSCG